MQTLSFKARLFLTVCLVGVELLTTAPRAHADDTHFDDHFYVASPASSPRPAVAGVRVIEPDYLGVLVKVSSDSGIKKDQLIAYVQKLLGLKDTYLVSVETGLKITDMGDVSFDDPLRSFSVYCVRQINGQKIPAIYKALASDICSICPPMLNPNVAKNPVLVLKNAADLVRRDLILAIAADINLIVSSLKGNTRVQVEGLDSDVKVIETASKDRVYVVLGYKVNFILDTKQVDTKPDDKK